MNNQNYLLLINNEISLFNVIYLLEQFNFLRVQPLYTYFLN